MPVNLEIDAAGLEAVRRSLEEMPRKILPVWARTVNRHAEKAIREVKTRHRSGPGRGPNRTQVGAGHLRNSYSQVTRVRGRQVVSTWGVTRASAKGRALKYAAVHEKDGVTIIRPRRRQFLAIPLPAAKRRDGTAPSPREWDNTFVRRGIIWQKRGRRIIPLYVLKRAVKVPGRPALRPVVERFERPMIVDLSRDAIHLLEAV